MKVDAPNNCPINERTADGDLVGRCYYYLKDGHCPRHGDVTEAVTRYIETGELTKERAIHEGKDEAVARKLAGLSVKVK